MVHAWDERLNKCRDDVGIKFTLPLVGILTNSQAAPWLGGRGFPYFQIKFE